MGAVNAVNFGWPRVGLVVEQRVEKTDLGRGELGAALGIVGG